jgi:6-phosphogluconolactonase
VDRKLVVVPDVAEEAVSLFLAAEPATVVLSGGSTPKAFYERLAGVDYDWNDVELFFGDERCVPADSEGSNAHMVDAALLSKIGGQAYRMDGARCDAEGYEDVLRQRFRDFPFFDLAVYGLGPDGHTASLFPGRPEVDETERWAVRVPEATQPPFVPRITLTAPVLSSAALGVFLVSGQEKAEALRRLMVGEDIPAARLAPKRLVVVADHSAAA